MKTTVWLAALLVFVAFVFPDGVRIVPSTPSGPVVVTPDGPNVPPDEKIRSILASADYADKGRIRGVYIGLRDVVKRDSGKLVKTTEQLAVLQANTLNLAVNDTPLKGKYPGLDAAIEGVFERELGKEKEAAPNNEETRKKIIAACDTIISSAR